MSESDPVAKNCIEFQWGSKLPGTSSEALVFVAYLTNGGCCNSWGEGYLYKVIGDVPLKWVAFLQEILKHGSPLKKKNP